MTGGMFIAGLCLVILFICQGYKVYKADKEFKEALADYLRDGRKKI